MKITVKNEIIRPNIKTGRKDYTWFHDPHARPHQANNLWNSLIVAMTPSSSLNRVPSYSMPNTR